MSLLLFLALFYLFFPFEFVTNSIVKLEVRKTCKQGQLHPNNGECGLGMHLFSLITQNGAVEEPHKVEMVWKVDEHNFLLESGEELFLIASSKIEKCMDLMQKKKELDQPEEMQVVRHQRQKSNIKGRKKYFFSVQKKGLKSAWFFDFISKYSCFSGKPPHEMNMQPVLPLMAPEEGDEERKQKNSEKTLSRTETRGTDELNSGAATVTVVAQVTNVPMQLHTKEPNVKVDLAKKTLEIGQITTITSRDGKCIVQAQKEGLTNGKSIEHLQGKVFADADGTLFYSLKGRQQNAKSTFDPRQNHMMFKLTFNSAELLKDFRQHVCQKVPELQEVNVVETDYQGI